MELLTGREVEIYFQGKREGLRSYAWWKDGTQYVGTTGKTLDQAKEEIFQERKKANDTLKEGKRVIL